MSQQANATAPRKHPQVPRTFAMTVVGAGCWAMVAGVAYFLAYLIVVYVPASGAVRMVPNLTPIFLSVATIFGSIGTLSLVWTGARRRAWFWLVPVILIVPFEAFNAQDIPYDLARPANTAPFLITVVFLAGSVAVIAGGITAFLEVRRGRPIWTRSGRAGWVSMAVVGIAVGAAEIGRASCRERVWIPV